MSAPDSPSAVVDSDIVETREWIESFDAFIHAHNSTRALPAAPTGRVRQGPYPSDLALEERLTSIMRWNALAMVTRANGTSPRDCVVRRRIEVAQALMLTTSEPLHSVALSCGMCDQQHFTRTFHRVVGETPSMWRRSRRGSLRADQVLAGRAGVAPL